MIFCRANFRLALMAGLFSVGILSAAAQNAAAPASKAIVFTAPAGDNAVSNTPSLVPRLSDRPEFADPVRAPVSIFNTPDPSSSLPFSSGVPTMTSRAEAQRLQRLQDERENWALLTPQEILGLTSSKNAFRTPEEAAADDQKETSVMARFLERQQHLHQAITNGYRDDSTSPEWDFSRNQGGLTNANPFNPSTARLPSMAQILNRLLNDAPANNPFAGPGGNQNAGWFSSLGLPPQPPAPTPEQLAERERFAPMPNPDAHSDATARTMSSGKPFSSLQPLSDLTPGQAPAVNPVGVSFAPLSDGISRPVGLTPLPGIVATNNGQWSTAPPAWAPQPPPWLLQAPQFYAVPQRKF